MAAQRPSLRLPQTMRLSETFRLHQHDLRQPVTIVLVARSSILGKQRADVERDFLSALRRAKLLKEP